MDQDRRRDIIKYGSMKLAKSVNGEIVPDEDLTEELTFIVEYPTPIMGEIQERYLELPKRSYNNSNERSFEIYTNL